MELPQQIRVISLSAMSLEVLRRVFELASLEFIHENVGGLGGSESFSCQDQLAAGAVDIRQKANILLR